MRRSGGGDADLLQQVDGRACASAVLDRQVGQDRLDDLVADPVERIEAGQRILEDHADPLAADVAHGRRRQIVDPLARQAGSRRRRCGRAAR